MVTSSVCMATFNGEKYIKFQIDSILDQLDSYDELIIVDDHSTDSTISIISKYNDNRIKLIQNDKNIGYIKSFNKAISCAKNEIIFLSDQDDVWTKGRKDLMVKNLEKYRAKLITTNYDCIDESGSEIRSTNNRIFFEGKAFPIIELIKIFLGTSPYLGCVMAFKRDIAPIICPIPGYSPSHDLWIAIACNLLNSSLYTKDISLKHRIHDTQLTPKTRRRAYQIILARFSEFLCICVLAYRIASNTKAIINRIHR